MSLDEVSWQRILDVLPAVEGEAGRPLAVAFASADDFAGKCGTACIWWPGSSTRAAGRVDFDGRYPADWGLLLVMSAAAVERLCAEGVACIPGLVRRVEIRPFVLQQRDELEAAGILEFIERLELATPKH